MSRLSARKRPLAVALVVVLVAAIVLVGPAPEPVAAESRLDVEQVAPDELVDLIYGDLLGRPADIKGREFWATAVASGEPISEIIEAFIESREVGGAYEPSIRLYRAAFLRPPDHDGLRYWVRAIRSGTSLSQVAEVFATSTEFTNRYGALDNAKYVERIYLNVLGRRPDASGQRHWTSQLAGGLSRGDLLLAFSESIENINRTSVSARLSLLSITLLRTIPSNDDMNRWSEWPSTTPTKTLIDRTLESDAFRTRLARLFPLKHPLTGQYGSADSPARNRPALAVKIDNVDRARPQIGLGLADVVYEEMVEGNLTRLIGVYHSQSPRVVGPVRSVRVSDFDILAAYNRPLLAASGANPGVLRALKDAPVVNVNALTVDEYWRNGDRRAPHNMMTSPAGLWSHSPDGASAPPVMFTTGDRPTVGQARPEGVTVEFGRATVGWKWDATAEVWRRTQNGKLHTEASGRPIGAENVIVMVTRYTPNAIDANSPEAHTVGRARAMIFTNGTMIDGFWQRERATDPIEFVDGNGRPVVVRSGQTWVELAPPTAIG